MTAYAFLIVCVAAPVSTLLVVLAVCTARTIKINRITISFLRIRVFTTRYTFSIIRRFLFYNIFSFLFIILRAISIPTKFRSGRLADARAKNNPLPLPTSTSSSAAFSNKIACSRRGGKSAASRKCRARSSLGSMLRRARRPIPTT